MIHLASIYHLNYIYSRLGEEKDKNRMPAIPHATNIDVVVLRYSIKKLQF
jgi:hypothetical protein